MFKKLSNLFGGADIVTGNSTMKLPIMALGEIVKHYKVDLKSSENIPILFVCIYNVGQLASAIAKHLKDGTNARTEDNKNG